MEINRMDSNSLNIMEYSLCLDAQHTPAASGKMSKTSPNSANVNRLSQYKSNLSSFYFTNDDDERDEEVINENEVKAAPNRGNTASYSSESLNKNGNNGIELDTVKHKLSSLWNNVKYGWANYLKKPNKIELDYNSPIFIMGKRYHPTHPDETNNDDDDNNNTTTTNNFNSSKTTPKKIGSSSFYDFFDDLSLNNNNKSDPEPNHRYKTSSNIPINTAQSINNNDDFSAMNFSYLSTSPFEPASLNSFKKPKLTNENMKTPLEQQIYSRLWFTYRKDFEPLPGNTKYTTDCGWGCMLRSAQMLIAQGLLLHYFGADWSLYTSLNSNKDFNLYKELVAIFNDRSSPSCVFGLHRLLKIADEKLIGVNDSEAKGNSRVGTWFGPTSVCLLMKDALNEGVSSNKLLANVRIYVAQDCTIFKQDVIDLCTGKLKKSQPGIEIDSFTPCIILISARLGGEELNEIYVDSLKMFLEMDMCLGIIGGKPKHSLYFIGYQGDKVVYLDPHFCQPMVNVYASGSDFEFFDNTSFHCANPSKVAFTKLDPSIAIGFYCKSRSELDKLCSLVKEMSISDGFYPIFGVCEQSFEQTQLNYQSFSVDDKMMESASRSRTSTGHLSIDNQNKAVKYSKEHHPRGAISSYLTTGKINSGGEMKKRSSSSGKIGKKNAKKGQDHDDFVLV